MNQIQTLFDYFNDLINTYKLSIILVLSIFTFILSGDVLRHIDMTAAPIDLGVLAVLPLSSLAVITFMLLSRWIINWQWPFLQSDHNYSFSRNFNSLLPWQKVLFYFSLYFLILFSFILVTMSFM